MSGPPDQLLRKPQLLACLGTQTPLCCFSVVVLKSAGSKGASSVLFWDVFFIERPTQPDQIRRAEKAAEIFSGQE